jgi:hypothetical protein
MLHAIHVFLKDLAAFKFDAPQGVIIGAAVTGLIALVTALITAWLRTRMEREKWLRDKKETAYRECLDLLCVSRRWPRASPGGANILGVPDYLGAMSSINKLPVWLPLVLNYSSEASKREIQEEADNLFKSIIRQKKLEQQEKKIPGHIEVDTDLFNSIEKLLTIIQGCSNKELNISTFWQRAWKAIVCR